MVSIRKTILSRIIYCLSTYITISRYRSIVYDIGVKVNYSTIRNFDENVLSRFKEKCICYTQT